MSDAGRIAVTGVGLWTALGRGRAANLSAFLAGETAFAPSRLVVEHGLDGRLVAEIDLPEADDADAWATRAERLATATVAEALAQAGIVPGQFAEPVELIASVSTGGMFETEKYLTRLWRGDLPSADALSALRGHPISGVVEDADRRLGPFSRTATVCSACSGGVVALGLGLSRLRLGHARVVVAGGVDSTSRLTVAGFGALQSLAPDGCHPFSLTRKGLVLGEGAGFLVLEREESARARGATILGFLAGYGVRSEAHHITHPEPAGTTPAQTIARALADAGISVSDVSYVSAHGTATPLNDAMEARALRLAFADHLPKVAVSSQKGQIGHTLAAAGAVEAAITLLAMGEGMALPHVTGGQVDPAFELPLVGPRGEPRDIPVAVSSSFGFGGTDAALVLEHAGRAANARSTPAPAARPRARAAIVASASFDPSADLVLEPERVRRFDAVSRAYAAVTDAVLRGTPIEARDETGLVVGSAFGSTDAAAAFLARLEEKGARFASPADFPNLVPSSAGANAAIYARLRGPSLTVAELSLSFFGALETSLDLLADGRGDAMVAAHVEIACGLIERALAPAAGTAVPGAPRGAGGGAVLLRREGESSGGVAAALGTLVAASARRREGISLPAPLDRARARVVLVVDDPAAKELISSSAWAEVPLSIAPLATVGHEAGAAVATLSAIAAFSSGELHEALVLQVMGDRVGYAHVVAPGADSDSAR